MTSIFTFDLSRKCSGWSFWKSGMPKPRAGTIKLPETDNLGIITNAFETRLLEVAHLVGGLSDCVWVYENPNIVAHGKKRADGSFGSQMGLNLIEIERTLGLAVMLRHIAAKYRAAGVEVDRAFRGQVAKHFTAIGNGKTSEIKTRMVLHCQAKGWNIDDHNIADAVAILDWWTYDRDVPGIPWDNSPCAGPLFGSPPINNHSAR